MMSVSAFLRVMEAYCLATNIAEATLSSRLFNDGKRASQLRVGADIGVRRLERASLWLSQHWPEGAQWPADVVRPSIISEAAE
jgi:hypothetical protein